MANRTTTSLTLNWSSTQSNFVTGYELQRCTGTGNTCGAATATWTAVATIPGRNTSFYTNTGLTTRTTYQYRLRAIVSALPGFVSTWNTAGGTTR